MLLNIDRIVHPAPLGGQYTAHYNIFLNLSSVLFAPSHLHRPSLFHLSREEEKNTAVLQFDFILLTTRSLHHRWLPSWQLPQRQLNECDWTVNIDGIFRLSGRKHTTHTERRAATCQEAIFICMWAFNCSGLCKEKRKEGRRRTAELWFHVVSLYTVPGGLRESSSLLSVLGHDVSHSA